MKEMKKLLEDMRARVAAFEAERAKASSQVEELEKTIEEDQAAIAKALQDMDADAHARMKAEKAFHEDQLEVFKHSKQLSFMSDNERVEAGSFARAAADADARPHLERLYQLRQEIMQEYKAIKAIREEHRMFARLVDKTREGFSSRGLTISPWDIHPDIAFVCTCMPHYVDRLHRGDQLLAAYAPTEKETK